ncbi:hypothetical protein [Ornithinicoccus hortensis]|uniref:Lipoprotein n=1 Tax=Ornithinicoccus hortensis TaxID=82346 RepID=A0A542YM20_9MICO|nr:hypothetical protein [Ornithinicoccus hortensis]TQL49132.1 hypothetical protein FB467_0197 [Ornithinicoccus hortensis]
MARSTVLTRVAVGALAAALTLTACSDDGGGDGGTGSGSTNGGSDAPADTGARATGDGSSGTGAPPADDAQTTTEPPAQALELPRGGTEFFPEYRLFGYSGAPGSEGLGRLGIGDLDERVVELEERGEEFADDREVMPVLELIATVVHGTPGQDGMFRTHLPDEVVQDHLDAARRHDGILLLNIQPGRADFVDELKYWEKWLEEPDVGVALDPEWAVEEGQIPGNVYGRTTGAELDECAAFLSDIVQEHGLPEKVMVYHQVHTSVVQDEQDLEAHEGVAIIKSVDGIGPPGDKIATYNLVNENKPEHVVPGFKLFYEEDAEWGPLMTAEEVLALDPEPEYILFE